MQEFVTTLFNGLSLGSIILLTSSVLRSPSA